MLAQERIPNSYIIFVYKDNILTQLKEMEGRTASTGWDCSAKITLKSHGVF
jgi:hypothetical protein